MATNLTELQAVLTQMESALKSITECDAEILEFIDAHYPDTLHDQKVVQVFKNVADAEDELQRQFNFMHRRLITAIPEFKSLYDSDS